MPLRFFGRRTAGDDSLSTGDAWFPVIVEDAVAVG
jgi:hypothetical protein